MEPLIPNHVMHLSRPILCSDDHSSWIGRKTTGLDRTKGTVLKVFSTPFSVQVAFLANATGGLGLQVTDLLSTPCKPAKQRAAYLSNERRMRAVFASDPERNPLAHAEWDRRVKLYLHYDFALRYVEAALFEHVREGDELIYPLGYRIVVVDPEVERCQASGRRQRIRVQSAANTRQPSARKPGRTDDYAGSLFLRNDGRACPLPSLGLI